MTKEEYESIAKEIVNSSFEVHKELRPGLLESVYECCFADELKSKGMNVATQVQLPIYYKERKLDKNFYIDVLIEDAIAIELKAIEILSPIHEVQLMTYMKLADLKLDFLINFNVPLIKNGIRRKVNKYFLAS